MVRFQELKQLARNHYLEDDPAVLEILEKAGKLDSHDSATAEKALQQYKRILNEKAVQKTRHPFPDPPSVNHWNPQLYLGETPTGSNLYVPLSDWAKHAAVMAQSGWGKTTLFRRLMIQLEQTDVNWWAFDINNDYRHLANRDDIDVLVVPFEQLKFNPLKPPPGVPIRDWKNTVAEIFADSQALLDASENYTDEQIEAVVDDFEDELSDRFTDYKQVAQNALSDTYEDGERPDYPTLLELEAAINDQGYHPSDPRASYQTRVLNRISSINRAAFHTVDCRHGHDLVHFLEEENVVFEFKGLRTNAQNFFMELLYAWILEYRDAQGHGDDRLRHVLFWDECKTIFSKFKERNADAGLPEILDKHDRSRNYGEASIGADQEPLKLAKSFLTNTYIKILGLQTDDEQFQKASRSMGFSEDHHQRRAARQIDTPYGLVTVGTRGPFKVRLPALEVTEDVDTDWLNQHNTPILNQHLQDYLPEHPTFRGSEASEHGSDSDMPPEDDAESSEELQIDVPEESHRLIADIAQNPTKSLTERYSEFSSTYMGNKAKKQLLEADLIEEISVSKAGSSITLLNVTERGRRYLDSQDIDRKWTGRGGVEHLYWQYRIENHLGELEYTTELEFQNRDVYGSAGDHEIAVEVALGKNFREIKHLEDAIERGYTHIVVAARDPEVKGYVRRKAVDNGLDEDRVLFSTVVEVANMDTLDDL